MEVRHAGQTGAATRKCLTGEGVWATFSRMRKARPLLVASVLVLVCGCGMVGDPDAPLPVPTDARASWVVRHQLATEESVERVVRDARAAGLNTLIVQVRGRGDAWYQGGLEPVALALAGSTFDPLETLIDLAHDDGISVHAWVNVNLVFNPARPHGDPRHLVNRHPDWLSIPEPLARQLVRLPARHQEFRERLLEYVQARTDTLEGLYADPSNPAYRDHVVAVCRDIAARYDVDGIHLDYIRYPNAKWGYSRHALDRLRVQVDPELTAADRADMARRVADDPLAYARRYPVRWSAFRRGAVDSTVQAVAAGVRRTRPGLTISAAVIPDISEARDERLQAWPEWISRGWLDVVCPMNYATADQRQVFEERTRTAMAVARPGRVWMGIGSWRLSIDETISRIGFARAQGAQGVALFSHGALQGLPGAFQRLRSTVFAPPRPPAR